MTVLILPFPEYTRTGSRKRLQSQSGINRSLSEGTPREGALSVIHTPRECPKVQELRRNTRQICKHFNWQFSER